MDQLFRRLRSQRSKSIELRSRKTGHRRTSSVGISEASRDSSPLHGIDHAVMTFDRKLFTVLTGFTSQTHQIPRVQLLDAHLCKPLEMHSFNLELSLLIP